MHSLTLWISACLFILQQLKQWREMKVNADDRGVKNLIIGLTNTDLRDTRNMIVKELQN